jgi:hypothetical protein
MAGGPGVRALRPPGLDQGWLVTVTEVLNGRAQWAAIEGESAEFLAGLPPNSVDAVVTDPPSGTGFMSKSWDTFTAKGSRDPAFGYWLAGFTDGPDSP